MRRRFRPRSAAVYAAFAASLLIVSTSPALATEGASTAGPIGGTDIRSALLPPPGLYGGIATVGTSITDLRDGSGNSIPGLDAVKINLVVGGPFLLYVPDVQVFGGSIGVFGVFPAAKVCGQLVSASPYRCISGFGDPYFEAMWSRSFGQVRMSRDPQAFPIREGLTIETGLGTVVPIGRYDQQGQATNGTTVGNNIFDLAPTFALTYTTPPLLAEGTEFSSKMFVNNYATNPATHYKTGQLLDIDFAVTEHIGRVQAGLAGFYAFQTQDDELSGVLVAPDGHRLRELSLGGVINYDMADLGAVLRLKYIRTVISRNTIVGQGVVLSFGKKLF